MKTKRVLKKNAIKAYKAFNSDLTCKGFQYEVGKEYHHKGKLELCEAGFHACERLVDCFSFYTFSEAETRVAEVLVWGKVEYEDVSVGVKLCASNIKVVRELTWNEVLFLCNSGRRNSGYGNSGNDNSGNCNGGDNNIGNSNSGYRNSGNHNTGSCNSGHSNTGNCNIGNHNTGSCNSGSFNLGNCNTGNSNSGYRNTGNWNTGSWNSGDCNTGNCNIGNNNTGNYNTGDYNTGNWNAGIFNTGACEYTFAFNQLVKKQDLEWFPSIPFLRFKLVEWIPEKHMLPEEKEQHPEYATVGGYLKKYDYKEAFRKSFEEAKRLPDWPEQLKRLKALPNFNFKIFEEISGITAEELTGSTVEKLTTKPKRKREKSTKGA